MTRLVFNKVQDLFCNFNLITSSRKRRVSLRELSKLKTGKDLDMKIKLFKFMSLAIQVQLRFMSLKQWICRFEPFWRIKLLKKQTADLSTEFKAAVMWQRKGFIHDTEKLLTIWVDNEMQKNMPVSLFYKNLRNFKIIHSFNGSFLGFVLRFNNRKAARSWQVQT